jgi:hypothetical protein
MRRERAEEVCQALAAAARVLEEALADVIEDGGTSGEVADCRAIIAPVMTSLFIAAAGPLILEYPHLEPMFKGPTERDIP